MKRLKELREDNDISISILLKLLNVSRTTYYNYENGICFPNYDTLKIIADFYNVSLDYLFERTNIKNNDNLHSKEVNLSIIYNNINITNSLTKDQKDSLAIIINSFLNK